MTLDLSTPQDPKPLDDTQYDRAKLSKKDEEETELFGDIAKRLNVDPKLNRLWINDGLRQGSRNARKMMNNTNKLKGKSQAKKKNDAGEDQDAREGAESGENDMETEDDEDDTIDAANKGPKKISTKSPAKSVPPPTEREQKAEKPRAVQILDLHQKNPIVSYGGQVFSCEWTRNIGTELLFIEHDRLNPLPILRHLDDGVDLLAASSIRLSSTPLELERKINAPSTSAESGGWAPEPVLTEREKKIEQKDFLTQLNQIKRDRGEEDGVTIHTKKQKTEVQWRDELIKKRKVEMNGLRRIIKAGQDMKEIEEAELRLKVLEQAEARRKSRPPKAKPGRKKNVKIDIPASLTSATEARTPFTRRSSMARMDGTWEVQTPGSQNWEEDGEDYVYADGMVQGDLYDEDGQFEQDYT